MQDTPSSQERKKVVRAVLFDAGNTLIRVATPVGRVYAETAGRHGIPADGEELERLFRAAFARRRGEFVARVSKPHSPEKERAWWRASIPACLASWSSWRHPSSPPRERGGSW